MFSLLATTYLSGFLSHGISLGALSRFTIDFLNQSVDRSLFIRLIAVRTLLYFSNRLLGAAALFWGGDFLDKSQRSLIK